MRVVICDDHRLFAESMAMVVRADGHEVTVVEDPGRAPAAVADQRADVCVMDLQFPGADGVEAVAEVRAAHPFVRILVLSGHLDDEVAGAAFRAGASACAVKCSPLDEVRRLMAGEVVDAIGPSSDPWQRDEVARFLTHREREVLEALTEGATTSELARRFGVSAATVSTHVQSILSKLGVHSRLEAVAFAVSRSLVEPGLRRRIAS